MKTKIYEQSEPRTPVDPWLDIKYPVLIECSTFDAIAIATTERHGFRLDNSALVVSGALWKETGWTPIKRPVTITFEN